MFEDPNKPNPKQDVRTSAAYSQVAKAERDLESIESFLAKSNSSNFEPPMLRTGVDVCLVSSLTGSSRGHRTDETSDVVNDMLNEVIEGDLMFLLERIQRIAEIRVKNAKRDALEEARAVVKELERG